MLSQCENSAAAVPKDADGKPTKACAPVDYSQAGTEYRKEGKRVVPLGLRSRVQLSIVIHPDGKTHVVSGVKQ